MHSKGLAEVGYNSNDLPVSAGQEGGLQGTRGWDDRPSVGQEVPARSDETGIGTSCWQWTVPMSVGKTRRQLTIRLSKAQWDWVFRVRRQQEQQAGQPVSYQEVVSSMLDSVILGSAMGSRK